MSKSLQKRQDAVNGAGPVDVAPRLSRTPAGDAFSRFAILVFRLSGALGAAGDALARPAGQTSARWQVLAGAESGSMTVADIARMLGLQRQSIQRVARRAERAAQAEHEDREPAEGIAGRRPRRPRSDIDWSRTIDSILSIL